MQARAVEAGRGWLWLIYGLVLFRRNPAMWIAVTLVLGVLWLTSLVIPVLGPVLFNLFSPALFAGLMVGCRAVENGEPLEIPHLFAGLRRQTAPLVTLGGVYLVGTIVVVGLVLVSAGGSMLPTVLSKGAGADIETLRAAVRSLAFALLVGAAAYVPLLMLMWFAPMLVMFEGLAPATAMRLSFSACLGNVLPFLVYGLLVLAGWVVISLPAALGAFGLVLVLVLMVTSIPVLVCSVYASYKDIFRKNPSERGPTDSLDAT